MDQARHDPSHAALRSYTWIAVITASSLILSRTFACVMPFAAIAAVAGSQLGRREAIAAVLLAWIGNQAVGFLLLGYPHGWSTFAWGGAIGLAALCAAGLAATAAASSVRPLVGGAIAFALAFVAYEGVLFAATSVLPSSGGVFAPWIVARVFAINATAFVGLFALHRVAVGFGLLPMLPRPRAALA